ncbi:hypothetical protein D9758_013319 [Tetrapyrgos nigripes]|uniref:F-box domain-containing protein n=1 Tax=Tetrapyrgos nigripes TaxID=182062 RepID=A0A8H5CEE0_9AGAR|nr:hypothetical protein D9758_013319 [Tetrapyrgos nigripes]
MLQFPSTYAFQSLIVHPKNESGTICIYTATSSGGDLISIDTNCNLKPTFERPARSLELNPLQFFLGLLAVGKLQNCKVQVHFDYPQLKVKRRRTYLHPYNRSSAMLNPSESEISPIHPSTNRRVLSIFEALPPEILIEIFSRCCTPGLSVDGREIVAPTLVISQTCSFWRKTALGAPELWSDLSLKIACDQPNTTGDLVDTYLQRSGSSLLSFAISAENKEINKVHFCCLWSILRSLLGSSGRWQSASFHFNRELLKHVDQSLQRKADSPERVYAKLKALSIVSEFGNVSHSEVFVGIWKRAPLLQSLKIDTFDSKAHSLIASECLSKCLRTLVLLTASGSSVSDVIQMVMNHPSLEELSFNIENSRDTRNDDHLPSPFSHSRLRSLSYDSSGCCLQVLKLGGGPFAAAEELVEILTLTPVVTEFELDVEEYLHLLSPVLFQSLTIGEDDPTPDSPLAPKVLPKLTCLRLGFYEDPYPFEDLPQFVPPNPPLPEAILSLVTSRRTLPANSSIAELAHFDLSVYFVTQKIGREWVGSFRSKVEPYLRVLEKDGLELSLDIDIEDWEEEEEEEEE